MIIGKPMTSLLQNLLPPVCTFRLDGTPMQLPLPQDFPTPLAYEIEDEYGRIITGQTVGSADFPLPRLSAGYHLLRFSVAEFQAETLLIVAPLQTYKASDTSPLTYAEPFNNFKSLRQNLSREPLDSLHITAPFPCAADLKSFYRQLFRQPQEKAKTEFEPEHALYLALRSQYPVNQDYNDWANNCFDYNKITSFKTKEFAKKSADKIAVAALALSEVDTCLREIAAFCRRHNGSVYVHSNLPLAAEYADFIAWRDRKLLLAKNLALPDYPNYVPYSPEALAAARYEPFIRLLRQNMSHADVFCFDNPQSLAGQFCLDAPFDNKFLQYDLEALLAITAIESHRHRCRIAALQTGDLALQIKEQFASFGVEFILPE